MGTSAAPPPPHPAPPPSPPRAPAFEDVPSLVEEPEVNPLERISQEIELHGPKHRNAVLRSRRSDDRVHELLVTHLVQRGWARMRNTFIEGEGGGIRTWHT